MQGQGQGRPSFSSDPNFLCFHYKVRRRRRGGPGAAGCGADAAIGRWIALRWVTPLLPPGALPARRAAAHTLCLAPQVDPCPRLYSHDWAACW